MNMHIKLKVGRSLINTDERGIKRILFEPYGVVFIVNDLWSHWICVYICYKGSIVEPIRFR